MDYFEGKVIGLADGLEVGYKKGVVKGDARVSGLNYQKNGVAITEMEKALAGADLGKDQGTHSDHVHLRCLLAM